MAALTCLRERFNGPTAHVGEVLLEAVEAAAPAYR
jgi:hypothetical protein